MSTGLNRHPLYWVRLWQIRNKIQRGQIHRKRTHQDRWCYHTHHIKHCLSLATQPVWLSGDFCCHHVSCSITHYGSVALVSHIDASSAPPKATNSVHRWPPPQWHTRSHTHLHQYPPPTTCPCSSAVSQGKHFHLSPSHMGSHCRASGDRRVTWQWIQILIIAGQLSLRFSRSQGRRFHPNQ